MDLNPNEKPDPTRLIPGNWSYARARELEGTVDEDVMGGIWPITIFRIMHGWGTIEMAQILQQNLSWPKATPSELDAYAKEGRIGFYYRAWNANDVVKAFRRGGSTSSHFRVTEDWRNPPEGILDFDQTGKEVLGGHSLPANPPIWYLPRPKMWPGDNYFVGKNSWGMDWGNLGCFAMSYRFFDKENYEAWSCGYIDIPPLYGNGIQHVKWDPLHNRDSDCKFFTYDVVDADNDDRLAWAMAVWRRGEIHIDDLFVKPEARGRGYADTMIKYYLEASEHYGAPLRFWIPWSDVDSTEKVENLTRFFAKYQFGFEASVYPSAPFCAVRGGNSTPPSFELPPRASFTFAGTQTPQAPVDWDGIRGQFNVSDDFIQQLQNVFTTHDSSLSRLA